MSADKRKPRLLCLHGAKSNNTITELQVMGINLDSHFDLVYLHAPFVTECYPGLENFADPPFYTWGRSHSSGAEREADRARSLKYICDFVDKHGPFEGVYGFSLGAAVITEFSHVKTWRDELKLRSCPWKFAILACGGASRFVSLDKAVPIEIPSFHIFGARDRLLEDSRKIADHWVGRITATHSSGHEIDMMMHRREIEMMKKLEDFLNMRLAEMRQRE